MEAVIFDISAFTVNDGPGIRTTVFFKGCPLRCLWCHNPEGLSPEPELCVKTAQCINCKKCLAGCSHPECGSWGRCLHICPRGNISITGKKYDTDSLAELLKRDTDLYLSSGGGVTFSGGEPLMHFAFIKALIPKLPGIHTAVETSGYLPPEIFTQTPDLIDYFMFDLKLFDREKHFKYTGVYNDIIHENLRLLQKSGKPHIVRIPLIPDITDTEVNLRGLARLAGDSEVELLPYNILAGAKYANYGRKYPLFDLLPKDADKYEESKKYFMHIKDM